MHAKGSDPRAFKEALEVYINKDHIKEGINRMFSNDELEVKGESVGRFLGASILWNSHNLVWGPDPKFRADETKGNKITGESFVDKAIHEQQDLKYQKHVDDVVSQWTDGRYMDGFEKFTELPKNEPVKWEMKDEHRRNPHKKWSVQNVSSYTRYICTYICTTNSRPENLVFHQSDFRIRALNEP